MLRLHVPERPDWPKRVQEAGLKSLASCEQRYWNEGVAYRFSPSEITQLREATESLYGLCLQAVDWVVQKKLYSSLGIPRRLAKEIAASWQRQDPSFFGRFDLAFDGENPPKMLEYNGVTPATLVEGMDVQSAWLRDMKASNHIPQESDEANGLRESYTRRFRELKAEGFLGDEPLVFATLLKLGGTDEVCDVEIETVEALQALAATAGIESRLIDMVKIGWNGNDFIDAEGKVFHTLFKYYPWDWIAKDPFVALLSRGTLRVIEPAWQAVLQSKGILPLLWELFPNHPNLAPSFFKRGQIPGVYVRKPLYGHEGNNISFLSKGEILAARGGPYAGVPMIEQAFIETKRFDGCTTTIGAWVVGRDFGQALGTFAGIGVREDDSRITGELCRYVPHFILCA